MVQRARGGGIVRGTWFAYELSSRLKPAHLTLPHPHNFIVLGALEKLSVGPICLGWLWFCIFPSRNPLPSQVVQW